VEEGDVVEGGDGDWMTEMGLVEEEVDFVGEGVGTAGFGEGVFVFCVALMVGVVVFVMVFTTVVLGEGGLVEESHVGLMSYSSCWMSCWLVDGVFVCCLH
jgi:hypothetical protein